MCRQLHYTNVARTFTNSIREEEKQLVVDVNCIGNESMLDDCSFTELGINECISDAGVSCGKFIPIFKALIQYTATVGVLKINACCYL